ncbi:MAG: Mth938-like domain-containing protein [Rubrobacteraceae bacterium]
MEQESRSPRLTHLSWGRLEVEGEDGPFKDARLFPGGARDWDWNETGTRHEPGIQPADVEELLERGATVVVLSKGFHERLRVMEETLRTLRDRGITVHVRQTEEAVRLYNELGETEKVGALMHSTC